MSIGEYKKEFITLYKKMQKEHGEVESVRIVQASKMVEGGIYMGSDIKCEIKF